MKVFVEIAEAADRADEVVDRVSQGDEILLSREGNPIVEMMPKDTDVWDKLRALISEDRANVPVGTTFNHDDLYDELGLPK